MSFNQQQSNFKNEFLAGVIGYFTTVYIVVVNGSILSETGISLENGMIATIMASFVGTMIMGLFGKLPLLLIPGMGINALFAYSIVEGSGFTFQEGLAVVFVAAVIFLITAFTKLGAILKKAIPESLTNAITIGIGFFLVLLGLEKSGLVVSGENTVIAIGDLTSPGVIVGIITLFIAIFLHVKNVPANLLITMVIGTLIAGAAGTLNTSGNDINLDGQQFLFLPSFARVGEITFWLSVFPLALILIFENMGLIQGQLQMLKREQSYAKANRITAFSTLTCAFFGTSPTVSAAENAAVIASNGRTGKTAVISGLLLLVTLFIIPWISMIPDTAISPILIIVGFIMIQNIRYLPFENTSETLPAFLLIVMIPFTYSIATGLAFGFVAYTLVKLAVGKQNELSLPLVIISVLFSIYIAMQMAGI